MRLIKPCPLFDAIVLAFHFHDPEEKKVNFSQILARNSCLLIAVLRSALRFVDIYVLRFWGTGSDHGHMIDGLFFSRNIEDPLAIGVK
ncbi:MULTISPECIES: hypothetical protein [unclassified Labrenzia]|uniref:hypothetical protein n=1 Tax=unclassified Labrenzia TaxID=2648686 RepID=UPI00190FA8B7|nr:MULTISPECIES: hypothetical protein [unclassified Labrenzia]